MSATPPDWTPADAERLYAIDLWGEGYFGVNEAGHMVARPRRDEGPAIDLHRLVEGLGERGVHPPVLVRFSDMLADRLRSIRASFEQAIADHGFRGEYLCIYPIKVNQNRLVCEEILAQGRTGGFGLEAGSKPELVGVLGMAARSPQVPIVCNGFKDERYLELVVLAHKLGRTITPIVERFEDLETLLRLGKKHGVRPRIGLRIKPHAQGAGRWTESGGWRSKFGLFTSQVLQAAEMLGAAGMLDCLELVHFHVGSQIADIASTRRAVTELSRIAVELRRMGAPIHWVDVGGGLGVDYDGSASATASSVNYSLAEYARSVVGSIGRAFDEADQPHPGIITEAGRAMTAHSSVLVFDVFGRSRLPDEPDLDAIDRMIAEGAPGVIEELRRGLDRLDADSFQDVYHSTLALRDEASSLFSLGMLGLAQRSAVEQMVWATIRRVHDLALEEDPELPDELAHLPTMLSEICYANMSVFQSMPDSWAIDQTFPVVPIARLDERPTRLGVLADLTCDSDGKLDRFPLERGTEGTIPIHPARPGEPYRMAAFLVGAYQEVLGDLHNLFGDTAVVHVSFNDAGRSMIRDSVPGERVRDVLRFVGYDAAELIENLRLEIEVATQEDRLSLGEGRSLLAVYRDTVDSGTYLGESDHPAEGK